MNFLNNSFIIFFFWIYPGEKALSFESFVNLCIEKNLFCKEKVTKFENSVDKLVNELIFYYKKY